MSLNLKQYISKDISSFSLTYPFRLIPDHDTKRGNKGEVFGMITVSGDDSFSGERLANFVWDAIIDEYRYSQKLPVEALKDSLKQGEKVLIEMIRNNKVLEAQGVNISLALCAFIQNKVYFAKLGEQEIFVIKNGKSVNITAILDKNYVSVGSSLLDPGDLVIISSPLLISSYFDTVDDFVLNTDRDFYISELDKFGSDLSGNQGFLLISQSSLDYQKAQKEAPAEIHEEMISNNDAFESGVQEENVGDDLADEQEIESKKNSLGFNNSVEDMKSSVDSTYKMYTAGGMKKPLSQVRLNNDIPEKASNSASTTDLKTRFSEGLSSATNRFSALKNGVSERINALKNKRNNTNQGNLFEENQEDSGFTGNNRNSREINNQTVRNTVANNNGISTQNISGSHFTPVNIDRNPVINSGGSVIRPEQNRNLPGKIGSVFDKVTGFFGNLIGSALTGIGNLLGNTYGRKLWYKRLMSRFSQMKMSSPNVKGIRIDQYKESQLRTRRFGIAVVFIALVIFVTLGVKYTMESKKNSEIHKQAQAYFTDIDKVFADVESNIRTDKEKANLSLSKADKTIADLKALNLNDADKKIVSEKEAKYLYLGDTLNKRIPLTEKTGNIEKYVDTSIMFGNKSQPTDIVIRKDKYLKETLFVTDAGEKSVFSVALDNKAINKLQDDGKIVQNPAYIDYGDTGIFVYDKVSGVIKADISDKEVISGFRQLAGLSVSELPANSTKALIILTAADNVYTIDSDKKALMKSGNSGSGYGLPYELLKNDAFANGVDVMADMSVYVIVSGADGIKRYVASGKGTMVESPLTISDLSVPFDDLTCGYTGGDATKNIYVFDRKSRRLLNFEKPVETGTDTKHPNNLLLIKQYTYRGDTRGVFDNVKDIVVDDAQRYMYVLDGNIIWRITL